MKKIFILISLVMMVGVEAQIPDASSISTAQKLEILKSLSTSDRQLLLEELQKNEGSQSEPLTQPEVVLQENTFNQEVEEDLLKLEQEVQKDCKYKYLQVLNREKETEEPGKSVNKFEQEYKESQFIKACVEKENRLAISKNLKPFGYDLFAGVPTTFAPATEIPVPQNYILGPGDTIKIFTYGNDSGSSSYVVDRNGVISIDSIGPLVVSGMSFSEVKQAIDDRFSTQMIGVKTSVTMGELRSIRIFILGEAKRPGSYTVSSLSTITNALFVSGGIKEIGSLRNIQLKRNGRVISSLDLYDLLLKGDTRNDARLQPGDVIFIPTIKAQVSVAGNVVRPAIYETKREHHLSDFITLAGGVLPNAKIDNIAIRRFIDNKERKIINADYTNTFGQQLKIKAGDIIEVGEVYSAIENSVELKGHVKQEGMKAFYIGMRVSDLVQNASNLNDKVDMDYALIRRMVPPANEIEVMSFNLRQALNNPGSLDNKTLQTGDTIYIFERGIDRNAIIDPLIEELEQQSGNGVLLKQVSVGGRVKVPGDYPLEAVMTVSDLIRAGGGLTDAAYRLEAELTRDALDHNSELEKEHIKIDLKRLLEGDRTADVMLQSRDRLYIKEVPNWREDNAIELMGEVQFPGEYYIKSGETLGQVMQRAGGLSDNAFAKGTLFIRDSLKEKENKFLATLADNLEKDIAMLSIEKESSAVDLGKSLLEQLRSAEAIGRLVIDLDSVMANIGNEFKDVILQNGDKILVPGKTQEVTVIGEVQFPTSHLHDGNNSRNVYLQKSGGFTAKADAKRVYIVRADGSVVGRESTAWFSRNEYIDIQPGDTIVVPLDSDRVRPLTLWTSVTQILYQLGIFAAAAKTVGVL